MIEFLQDLLSAKNIYNKSILNNMLFLILIYLLNRQSET